MTAKLVLLWLAAAIGLVLLFLFLTGLVRELLLDLKVRRAGKQCYQADEPIRREYSIKDSPAWGRLPEERALQLRVKLQGLSE